MQQLVRTQEELASQRGATGVEYALLVLLIAAAIIGVLLLMGPRVAHLYGLATNGW